MKNILAFICALGLVGCIGSSEPIDNSTEDLPTKGDPVSLSDYNHNTGYGCQYVKYQSVIVDGETYIVRIFAMCRVEIFHTEGDPQPDILKGNPGPDMGDPWDGDKLLKEKILKAFNSQNSV